MSNKRKKWTKDIISEMIINLKKDNIPLSYSNMRKDEILRKLNVAGVRYFGSWENALISSGVDPKEEIIMRRNYWSKELIIKMIHKRHDSGLSLFTNDVKREDSTLFSSAVAHFKRWTEAIKASEIKIDRYKRQDSWNADKIINELNKRFKYELSLGSQKLQIEDHNLHHACIVHFGSYKSAIEACGWDYDEIRQDSLLMSYYGIKFEGLVGEILKEIHGKIIQKGSKNKKIRPDFNLGNGHWIDIKLSYATVLNSGTIEKYEPHCKKLTIIFLRGSKIDEEKISNKTSRVSIYTILNSLPEERQKHYIVLLDELYNQANRQESKIDKELTLRKKSIYRGVYWSGKSQKWQTKIMIDRKRIYLGRSSSEEEAAKIYDDYVIENKLNKQSNLLTNPYFINKK